MHNFQREGNHPCSLRETNAMFGSFEREESSGEESRDEWLSSTLFGYF